jgi:hypothetical protein
VIHFILNDYYCDEFIHCSWQFIVSDTLWQVKELKAQISLPHVGSITEQTLAAYVENVIFFSAHFIWCTGIRY